MKKNLIGLASKVIGMSVRTCSDRFSVAIMVLATVMIPVLVHAQDERSFQTGRLIYNKQCASCHGSQGQGVDFLPKATKFNDSQYMATRSDTELLEIIAHGKKQDGMPAWNGILSEADQRAVLSYIRSLASRADPPR